MPTSESREGDWPPSQSSCSGQEPQGRPRGALPVACGGDGACWGSRDWPGGRFGASVKVALAFCYSPSTLCEPPACQALCWKPQTRGPRRGGLRGGVSCTCQEVTEVDTCDQQIHVVPTPHPGAGILHREPGDCEIMACGGAGGGAPGRVTRWREVSLELEGTKQKQGPTQSSTGLCCGR